MKRILAFALAASLLAFITILAADTASAQTTGSAQKIQEQQKTMQQQKTSQGQRWGSFDDDGDGILNCQDPDYVRPRDGTGKQLGKMHHGKGMHGKGGYGLGNSAGNAGSGTGVCDGKGRGR